MVETQAPSSQEPSSPASRQGSASELKELVTSYALEMGFDLVRVASAQDFQEDRNITLDRIAGGLMNGLPWFNESRVLRGTTPENLLPGARSIICLGLNYFDSDHSFPNGGKGSGKVARYAWRRDYHKVIKNRMQAYVAGLQAKLGQEFGARWYVDDGPMLDRAAANRAGLGWFGKNTNILTPSLGSWVFLGQVVTDLELEADQPLKKTCGSCVRCIDACPTGAIIAPYVIDNERCISYLTIENRGEIPMEFRAQVGDWVFGCDICQEVCPVNHKANASPTLWQSGIANSSPGAVVTGRKPLATLDLVRLLEMSEEEFREEFQGSPILRAKREGLQRNACVGLGNNGDPSAIPSLCQALETGQPLVRGHAAWALGKIGGRQAEEALKQAQSIELDSSVVGEIKQALLMVGDRNSD